MKQLTDKFFSRKLAAFLVATLALWVGVINQDAWEGVAIAYLGAQGLVDLAQLGVSKLKDKAQGTAFAPTVVEKTPVKKTPVKKTPVKKTSGKAPAKK